MPLLIVIPFGVIAFTGYWEDHQVPYVWIWLNVPLIVIHAAVAIYALVFVFRYLRGKRLVLWLVAFFLLGSLSIPLWWWRLVRPLPEPDQDSSVDFVSVGRT